MAPIIIDPNSDATVHVIEMDEEETVRRVEFRVLEAALDKSSYWSDLFDHKYISGGFQANGKADEHSEDTIISTTAVEIVLRALHFDYHTKLNVFVASDNGDKAGPNGGEDNDELPSKDTIPGRESSPATSMWKEETNGCNLAAELDEGATNENRASVQAADHKQSVQLETYFPREMFEVSIDDVWGVLLLINFKTCLVEHKAKLDVDRTILQPWFCKWREINFPKFNQQDFQYILFPTFAFNDAKGWSYVTEWLCKHTSRGQIEERSPFRNNPALGSYRHLHLPKEVIARIRVCRSQLYVRMEEVLWDHIRDIWLNINATCACRVVATYNYRKALQHAGALEWKHVKGRSDAVERGCDRLDQDKTLQDLIKCLDKVAYEEPLNPCIHCNVAAVTSNLSKAKYVATSFKGLCLDCMEGSLDGDARQRFGFNRYKNWAKRLDDCRVPHDHTTWYFSWINPIPRQFIIPPPQQPRKRVGERPGHWVFRRLNEPGW